MVPLILGNPQMFRTGHRHRFAGQLSLWNGSLLLPEETGCLKEVHPAYLEIQIFVQSAQNPSLSNAGTFPVLNIWLPLLRVIMIVCRILITIITVILTTVILITTTMIIITMITTAHQAKLCICPKARGSSPEGPGLSKAYIPPPK